MVDDQSALVVVEKSHMYRGCLVVDTGGSCSVSPLQAADLLQVDRLEEETYFYHEVIPPDKSFGFANGLSHRCVYQVAQGFSCGLLAGETSTLQMLDQPGNSTAPLLSIANLAALGAVLDLATPSISMRGRAPVKVPRSDTGLIITPSDTGRS